MDDSCCFEQLWLREWPAGHFPDAIAAIRQPGTVVLDTCLRQLAFGLGAPPDIGGANGCRGLAAYQYLLEVICGLQSAVAGETNVLGQFRRAWQSAAPSLSARRAKALQAIVAALLADARSVRRDHLQGVAGGSYGSLVRALLAPAHDARVLFVGTGELARSMLPLFAAFHVGVWNHRPAAPLAGVSRWFAPDETAVAAAWAEHVVLTTPPDDSLDACWRMQLGQHRISGLVHLGRRQGNAGHWPGVARALHLDDVFALASQRDQQRAVQVARARAACRTLSRARLASDLANPMVANPMLADAARAWSLPALASA